MGERNREGDGVGRAGQQTNLKVMVCLMEEDEKGQRPNGIRRTKEPTDAAVFSSRL